MPNSKLKFKLFEGEKVDFTNTDSPSTATDAELNNRYLTEGVRIVVEQARYPLNQILTMFQETFGTGDGTQLKYKRDPEYQRRHRWTAQRQSSLIESFLMNVPVPPVFLFEYDLARFEVMDGRQRLTALMEFYSSELKLTGLKYWPELEGRTYDTLPDSIRDGIDRRYLSSVILLHETAGTPEQTAGLKKMVFERLNSGGVELSGQETRNAIYNGPLNDLTLELSRHQNFKEILGTPTDSDSSSDELLDGDEFDENEIGKEAGANTEFVTNLGRKMFRSMEDVEIVLRFFAYRHIDKFSPGLNKIREFLDEFLEEGNSFDKKLLEKYKNTFIENIDFWYSISGSKAFQVEGSNRSFSKIAFDALMYASSTLSKEQRDTLGAKKEDVSAEISKMYSGNGAVFGGRKTNKADATKRNKAVLKALSNVLGN